MHTSYELFKFDIVCVLAPLVISKVFFAFDSVYFNQHVKTPLAQASFQLTRAMQPRRFLVWR